MLFLNAFSQSVHHFFLVNYECSADSFQGGDMDSRDNHPDFFCSKSRRTNGDLSWKDALWENIAKTDYILCG
jgi:hypothetical protein